MTRAGRLGMVLSLTALALAAVPAVGGGHRDGKDREVWQQSVHLGAKVCMRNKFGRERFQARYGFKHVETGRELVIGPGDRQGGVSVTFRDW